MYSVLTKYLHSMSTLVELIVILTQGLQGQNEIHFGCPIHMLSGTIFQIPVLSSLLYAKTPLALIPNPIILLKQKEFEIKDNVLELEDINDLRRTNKTS